MASANCSGCGKVITMDPEEIARLVEELDLEAETNEAVVDFNEHSSSQLGAFNGANLKKLLVGKIFATRVVNRETLRMHLPRILQIRSEADIEMVGDNAFVVVFANERDRLHALYDGPWHYFDNLMLFKEPKGLEKPSDVQFTEFTTWIQCHNLSVACMNLFSIRKIGEVVGKVEEIDIGEGGNCLGQYARARVTRDIDKPLQRCVLITAGSTKEAQTILIRYEHLPEFCSACGRVGHAVRFCQDDTVDKTKKTFGQWLKVARTADMRRGRRVDTQQGMEGASSSRQTSNKTGSGGPHNGHSSGEKSGPRSNLRITGEKEISESEGSDAQRDTIQPKTNADKDLSITRCKEVIEEVGINEGDMGEGSEEQEKPSSTQLQKRKSSQGWKRRARSESQIHDYPGMDCSEDLPHHLGSKRGGTAPEIEEVERPIKQARTGAETTSVKEPTAVVAVQHRRSPLVA